MKFKEIRYVCQVAQSDRMGFNQDCLTQKHLCSCFILGLVYHQVPLQFSETRRNFVLRKYIPRQRVLLKTQILSLSKEGPKGTEISVFSWA